MPLKYCVVFCLFVFCCFGGFDTLAFCFKKSQLDISFGVLVLYIHIPFLPTSKQRLMKGPSPEKARVAQTLGNPLLSCLLPLVALLSQLDIFAY